MSHTNPAITYGFQITLPSDLCISPNIAASKELLPELSWPIIIDSLPNSKKNIY